MKFFYLKTFAVLLTAISIFYACNKQPLNQDENLNTTIQKVNTKQTAENSLLVTSNPFKKTVGAPIDVATGKRWIGNYTNAKRVSEVSYIIKGKDLKAILSNKSCVGICLYYALDGKKQTHILPIGINENGRMIKSKSISTHEGIINWETAQKWINNYTGAVQAHFFGSNTFGRLLSNTSRMEIRATVALNDENEPQLLLSNAAAEAAVQYEDDSVTCPPVCPKP